MIFVSDWFSAGVCCWLVFFARPKLLQQTTLLQKVGFLRGLLKNTPLTALLSGLKDAETLLQPQLSSLAEALGHWDELCQYAVCKCSTSH